ncbi:MAG: DUF3570 domain-containing protein [Bacteroidetes bacterium]|jgi:hypothetical protein|nr:DUF3570 domain-containing protein [Bacteroidota bacterium]MBP7256814.1 DUF3570 domain-containing protein [Chitinophagales bacterium]MBK7504395.1 DUF3570 domain-containing protein [Bacteroidota bacterium]MBK7638600.1 DUF3570 domain-containing protein [Bacteroidota bacterium]MBK8672130.1 DUF3570 domain-containing protein [Bacteroidota bacterium]
MRKITLSALGIFAGILSIFSQEKTDSTTFKSKKLSLEEINIVSSYYHQDGNNSAITGGIGTEKLSDYANFINIKLNKYNKKELKHSIDLEIGIDHFTSASSDNVSPNTGTNASTSSVDAKDTRIYPAINWQVENEKKGTTFGTGLSVSSEFDYLSFGANFIYGKKFNQNNSEISGKVQVYIDQLKLVYPAELIPISAASSNGGHDDDDDKYISNFEEEEGKSEGNYPTRLRNSFSNSITFAQIINKNIQVAFTADAVYQNGYLGLPFHRVYFNDNSVAVENLPSNRFKLPLAVRGSFFIGDRFIIRSFYRFYYDTWNLKSNTFNLETPIKITPFVSVSPFYRFYQQNGIKYFAPYKIHSKNEQYFTSNYDLGKFISHFVGAGIRLAPPNGIFNLKHFNMIEVRYGYYLKNIGMKAQIVSLNLKFK